MGASALNYVVIVALARVLGSEQYGVYTYVFAWLGVLGLVARMGWPGSAVHFLPTYEAAGHWDLIRAFLRRATTAVAAVSGVLGLLGACLVWGLAPWLDPLLAEPLAWGVLGLPVVAFGVFAAQVGRAFGWITLAYAPPQFGQPLLLLVVIAGLWATSPTSALVMVLATLATIAAAAMVQALVYRHRLRDRIAEQPHAAARAEWWQASVALLLVDSAIVLLGQIDIVLLGSYVPASTVGHYGAAVRVAMLVHFVMQAMVSLAEPRLAGLWSQGRHADTRAIWMNMRRYATVPAALMLVIIVFAGEHLLRLFGDGFEAALPVLLVLATGNLLVVACGPVVPALKATGRRRPCAVVFGLACIVAVGLDVLLIPTFGAIGAAVGTAITVFAAHVALAVIVRRELGFGGERA